MKENTPEIKEIGGVEYEVVSTVRKEKNAAAKKQKAESSQEEKQVVLNFLVANLLYSLYPSVSP